MLNDILTTIYDSVEASLTEAGFTCRGCGNCCDFDANDYVLYASRPEVELVVSKTGVRPRLVGGRCCFQDTEGRCTIHRWRPLGCRTFFCSTASPTPNHIDNFQQLYENALDEIKAVELAGDREWRYERFFEG